MTITMHPIDGGVTQLRVDGAMTIYEAARDRQALLAALRAGVPLAVDLSGVDEIDTAGVQLLVLARREAAREGLAFLVTDASAAVAEALERYGLVDVVTSPAGCLPEPPIAERNDHDS